MNFDAYVGTVFTQFVFIHVRNQRGGGGGGGPARTLENYKIYGFFKTFLSNTGPDPLKSQS